MTRYAGPAGDLPSPSEALWIALRGLGRAQAPGHPSARGDRSQSAALPATSGQLAWGICGLRAPLPPSRCADEDRKYTAPTCSIPLFTKQFAPAGTAPHSTTINRRRLPPAMGGLHRCASPHWRRLPKRRRASCAPRLPIDPSVASGPYLASIPTARSTWGTRVMIDAPSPPEPPRDPARRITIPKAHSPPRCSRRRGSPSLVRALLPGAVDLVSLCAISGEAVLLHAVVDNRHRGTR